MAADVEVTGPMVIRGVRYYTDLRGFEPTAGEVAEYLEVDEEQVLKCLVTLRRKRLFRDRRSQGQRVWRPW